MNFFDLTQKCEKAYKLFIGDPIFDIYPYQMNDAAIASIFERDDTNSIFNRCFRIYEVSETRNFAPNTDATKITCTSISHKIELYRNCFENHSPYCGEVRNNYIWELDKDYICSTLNGNPIDYSQFCKMFGIKLLCTSSFITAVGYGSVFPPTKSFAYSFHDISKSEDMNFLREEIIDMQIKYLKHVRNNPFFIIPHDVTYDVNENMIIAVMKIAKKYAPILESKIVELSNEKFNSPLKL